MGGKEYSTAKRNEIMQFLLESSQDGKVPHGKITEAKSIFGASRRTITRFWTDAKKQKSETRVIHSIGKRNYAKTTVLGELVLEKIKALPVTQRSSIRTLADGIDCKKSTVDRWISKGLIKPHTNAIKPCLTAASKMRRLRFSLDALEMDMIHNKLQFKTMHNIVHVDEKWFYMTKVNRRFYLAPGEAEPLRTCQSKNHIEKVMFMSAVARPIFHDDGSVLFDGKIGIFPFSEMVPAKRNSKNRPAGTLEEKAIQSINQAIIKNNFINQIIPAIKAKWPEGASKVIYIQQDNARPHIKDDDPDFRAVASSDGFDIRIIQQPANSPNMNINDLGWFRALQSMQQKSVCLNTSQLFAAVRESFQNLEATKLNKVFLTLQSCMLEVMRNKGHNSYRIPHTKKDAAARQNMLPTTLEAPDTLVRECIDHLIALGVDDGISELIEHLGMTQNAQ